MVLGILASNSSEYIVPEADMYGIRNLASNSSDHIVPEADMYGIRNLGQQFI